MKMYWTAYGTAAVSLLLHHPSNRHLAASSPSTCGNGPSRRSGCGLATPAHCADAGPGSGPDHERGERVHANRHPRAADYHTVIVPIATLQQRHRA